MKIVGFNNSLFTFHKVKVYFIITKNRTSFDESKFHPLLI